jgi:hypothetical protein
VLPAARELGVRREPFHVRGEDGAGAVARGSYQKIAGRRLDEAVATLRARAARPLMRSLEKLCAAVKRWGRVKERERVFAANGGSSAPVVFGGAKLWMTVVLGALFCVDIAAAYPAIESFNLPGPITLIAALGIVAIMTFVGWALGRIGWVVLHREEYGLDYRREVVLKAGIAVVGLFLAVLVGAFAIVCAQHGSPVLWIAVAVLSVLMAVWLGATHQEGALEADLRRAERKAIRTARRLDRVAGHCVALGAGQLGAVDSVLAKADRVLARVHGRRWRDELPPQIPDPGLLSEAQIADRVLAPLQLAGGEDLPVEVLQHIGRIRGEFAGASPQLNPAS